MAALFPPQSGYNASYGSDPYSAPSSSNLQFYSAGGQSQGSGPSSTAGYSRSSLEGNMSAAGGGSSSAAGAFGAGGGAAPSAAERSYMSSQMSFWSAFGTGGFPDEPSLMEELGVNLPHIVGKSLVVLNPLHRYSPNHQRDSHMMDDTDLAGPLLFCFVFGILLFLAGKSHFGYIYGVALLGSLSIYLLLNAMSEDGIDAYRVMSVLGYCLLPLCGLASLGVLARAFGGASLLPIITPFFIFWSSYSSSGIFASVLHLNEQRFLVGYPLMLLYTAFAVIGIFGEDAVVKASGVVRGGK
ncbi:Yip1-domain-containing protein [Microstroma glucosiphilum]|uniref:Protein YIP n=1 Tax=Pseudomicrostroma glucosiphilum TaxID=1684307 RepID=A0A316U140_9BASI|nr:Yip1-domain-containing protein [Pseudomicrostroma glucosiphilum]PWN19106.1 Yip1-domain-containing protein [Pseudomicrostroma glucosiphilum]